MEQCRKQDVDYVKLVPGGCVGFEITVGWSAAEAACQLVMFVLNDVLLQYQYNISTIPVQYNTSTIPVQYQYNTVQYQYNTSTILYNTSTILYNTIPVQYSTIQYQYNTSTKFKKNILK